MIDTILTQSVNECNYWKYTIIVYIHLQMVYMTGLWW